MSITTPHREVGRPQWRTRVSAHEAAGDARGLERVMETRPVAALVLLAALAVWAMVGFALWVSVVLVALIRVAVAFVGRVFGVGQVEAALHRLHRSLGFYRRGFLIGVEAVLRIWTKRPRRKLGGP